MCANWKTLSREPWYSPLRNALTWTFCRKVSAARKLFAASGCSFPSFCLHCPLSQARVTPRTIRIHHCFKSWTKSNAASSSTCSSAPAGTRPKPRSDFSSPFQHSTRKSSVSESMFVAAAAATRRLPPPWESNRWLVSEIFSVVSPSRNSPPNRVHYGHISMAKSLPPAHLSGISASQHEWPVLLECASPKCDAVKLNELLRSADWTRLLLLAEEHGVVGHLAAHLHELDRDLVPPEMNKTLMECQREQIFLTLRLTAELFRLLKRFAAAEIGVLAVKGPVLSLRAYGDPAMRSYGDLDLLVRQRDIRRATELMIAAGYQAAVPVSAIDSGKIPGQYLFSPPAPPRKIFRTPGLCAARFPQSPRTFSGRRIGADLRSWGKTLLGAFDVDCRRRRAGLQPNKPGLEAGRRVGQRSRSGTHAARRAVACGKPAESAAPRQSLADGSLRLWRREARRAGSRMAPRRRFFPAGSFDTRPLSNAHVWQFDFGSRLSAQTLFFAHGRGLEGKRGRKTALVP